MGRDRDYSEETKFRCYHRLIMERKKILETRSSVDQGQATQSAEDTTLSSPFLNFLVLPVSRYAFPLPPRSPIQRERISE